MYQITSKCGRGKKECYKSGLSLSEAKQVLMDFWNNHVGEKGSYFTGGKLRMILNNEPVLTLEITN